MTGVRYALGQMAGSGTPLVYGTVPASGGGQAIDVVLTAFSVSFVAVVIGVVGSFGFVQRVAAALGGRSTHCISPNSSADPIALVRIISFFSEINLKTTILKNPSQKKGLQSLITVHGDRRPKRERRCLGEDRA